LVVIDFQAVTCLYQYPQDQLPEDAESQHWILPQCEREVDPGKRWDGMLRGRVDKWVTEFPEAFPDSARVPHFVDL
jgi:hypothetical protein